MTLQLYTKAVIQRIKYNFPNSYYSIYEQLLEKAANANTQDNLPIFPVIGIYRVGWEIDTNQSYEQSFQGTSRLRNVTNAEGEFLKLKRRAIRISFQFDVISDNQEEMDEISSELYWELSNFPRLSFSIQSPIIFTFNESNLFYQGVTDNTDVTSFKELGRIYRTTFDYTLEGCYLINWTDWEEVRQISLTLNTENQ